MTREEQKAYNAENYPASVLSWLNEATDRAFDEFESRTECKLADLLNKEKKDHIRTHKYMQIFFVISIILAITIGIMPCK